MSSRSRTVSLVATAAAGGRAGDGRSGRGGRPASAPEGSLQLSADVDPFAIASSPSGTRVVGAGGRVFDSENYSIQPGSRFDNEASEHTAAVCPNGTVAYGADASERWLVTVLSGPPGIF